MSTTKTKHTINAIRAERDSAVMAMDKAAKKLGDTETKAFELMAELAGAKETIATLEATIDGHREADKAQQLVIENLTNELKGFRESIGKVLGANVEGTAPTTA